jgi:hypothetical protein
MPNDFQSFKQSTHRENMSMPKMQNTGMIKTGPTASPLQKNTNGMAKKMSNKGMKKGKY